ESKEKCSDPIDCLVKFLFTALLILMVLGIAKLTENVPCCMTFYQPEFPKKTNRHLHHRKNTPAALGFPA
ncbi:MAG: cyclic lactone autoinducer peptide, partial [Firmicutes bacterium]|nr:cyclic lactone autoinducer peptide [Bacillota bacterium]